MKNLLLFPLRVCTTMLRKMSDLVFSAMRMSALNWLQIGRNAANAGLDVAQNAKSHARELAERVREEK